MGDAIEPASSSRIKTVELSARVLAMASALAAVSWTALVALKPDPFFAVAAVFCAGWLLVSALALGGPRVRELLRVRPSDVLVGITIAIVLFAGARATLWALTGGVTNALSAPVQRIYAAFGGGSLLAALALTLVIAPAEELFWRGLVLQRLQQLTYRPWLALTLMALGSSLLLLVFAEPVLALAAFPTSFVWGALVSWRRSLWPALISHSLWDLLIFVIAPAT